MSLTSITKIWIPTLVAMLFIIFLLSKNSTTTNHSKYIDSNYNSSEVHPYMLELYRSQINQRKAALKRVFDSDHWGNIYNTLVPEVLCLNLGRIGKVTDGGKWICNPTNMLDMPSCIIYSLGINNDPSFDEDVQKFLNNKCKLRAFDKGEQRPETLKRIKNANGVFMKALIAGTTNQSNDQYTFKDILEKFGDKRVDILKIDIEGAEHAISDELISVPICQILIEIHSPTIKKSALKTLNLLQKFSRNGFYLFSYEINGGYHHLSEYSFIHESCFEDYGVKTIYGKYLS